MTRNETWILANLLPTLSNYIIFYFHFVRDIYPLRSMELEEIGQWRWLGKVALVGGINLRPRSRDLLVDMLELKQARYLASFQLLCFYLHVQTNLFCHFLSGLLLIRFMQNWSKIWKCPKWTYQVSTSTVATAPKWSSYSNHGLAWEH